MPAVENMATYRHPSPPEHCWTQKENTADVFSTRDEDDPLACDGELEVTSEPIRPPLHLLVQLQ